MDARAPLVWHLEKLPYFVAIAESGSFRKASRALRLAQPTLSKSVAALEDATGVTLFARQKTGATLTREGAILLEAARDILRSAARAQSELKAPAPSRQLGIITHELLVPLVAESLAALPKGTLEAHVKTSPSVRQLLDWIEDYRADVAIVATSPPRKGLRLAPLFTDEYRFFCARSQKRALASAKRPDDLPLVLAPNVLAGAGETLTEHLQRHRIELTPKHVVGSLESVAALTAAGLGVGLLPARIGRLLQGDKIAELPGIKLPGLAPIGPIGFFFCCREDTWKNDELARALFKAWPRSSKQAPSQGSSPR